MKYSLYAWQWHWRILKRRIKLFAFAFLINLFLLVYDSWVVQHWSGAITKSKKVKFISLVNYYHERDWRTFNLQKCKPNFFLSKGILSKSPDAAYPLAKVIAKPWSYETLKKLEHMVKYSLLLFSSSLITFIINNALPIFFICLFTCFWKYSSKIYVTFGRVTS